MSAASIKVPGGEVAVSSRLGLSCGKNCSSACWCEHTEICGALPDGSRVKRLCPGWVGSSPTFMALLHLCVLWVSLRNGSCELVILRAIFMTRSRDFMFSSEQQGHHVLMSSFVIYKPAVASCPCCSNCGCPGARSYLKQAT